MRLARGAAGRYAVRAAQMLLFVGGLMVLGFVLGGQAQAAERPGAAAVERVPDTGRTAESAEPTASRAAGHASRLSEHSAGPDPSRPVESAESAGGAVAKHVVEPVVHSVVEPVEQAVEGAVQGVGRGVEQALPEGPLPAPSLPERPGAGIPVPVPSSPADPAPGPAATPGQDLPQTATAPAAGHGDDPRAAGSAGTQAYDSTYAGSAVAVHRTRVGPALGGGLPLAPPGRAPAAPGGCAVAQTAGDGHTHRGELQGALSQDAVEHGLLPGPRQPVTGTAVRERHRDILEFPG
ncbi:hypothetical protein [Streptomyces sp. FIT100]|uniref:hypothetical protein n=1 Tax=Streptomyces sp. FIT100 TaxID=2837956 RepID=UPI0021C9497C|nr:hypothetical protein [Streptomyces sp. FIT100]UUN28709.1 hypothetical protein KK483_21730 [Streptomyces sp. FIT100]